MKVHLFYSVFCFVISFVHGLLPAGISQLNKSSFPRSSIKSLIINGVPSRNYVFYVRVMFRDSSLFCGGARVEENWIITAARCLSNKKSKFCDLLCNSFFSLKFRQNFGKFTFRLFIYVANMGLHGLLSYFSDKFRSNFI